MTVRTRSARRRSAPERSVPAQQHKQELQSGKWANLLFLTIAVVGCLHVTAMLGLETWRNVVSRSEIVRLSADVRALEFERDGLQAVIAHADDEVYREQLARCLGFIYPNETRYITLTEGENLEMPVGSYCN